MLRAVSRPKDTELNGSLPFVAFFGMYRMRMGSVLFHDILPRATEQPGVYVKPEEDYASLECRADSAGKRGKALMTYQRTVVQPGQPYSAAGDYVKMTYENCIGIETGRLLNGTIKTTFMRELKGHYAPPQGNAPQVFFRAEFMPFQSELLAANGTPTGSFFRFEGRVEGYFATTSPYNLVDIIAVESGSEVRIRERGRDDEYTEWTGAYGSNGGGRHTYRLSGNDVTNLFVETGNVLEGLDFTRSDYTPTAGTQIGTTNGGGRVTIEYTNRGPVLR